MADPTFKSIVYALHDSVMVLAPPGWAELELTFAPGPHGLRLDALQTKGTGSNTPPPRPNLRIEPRDEAQRFSDAFSDLVSTLSAQGKQWQPGLLKIMRTPDFCDFKLLKPDGTAAWFDRLTRVELDELLITDALLDALSGTERAFDDLQQRLEHHLEHATAFDFDDRDTSLVLTMTDGTKERFAVQVVGQYLTEAFTWSWAWANAEPKEPSCALVRRVCAPDHEPKGLSALWRPHFHCDEGFAWSLASHVVVSIGARGLYRGELPDGSGVILFALMPEKRQ